MRDRACVNYEFSFAAYTNPEGYEDQVTWSGGENPPFGSGQEYKTRWSTTGTHTVTAVLFGGQSLDKQVLTAAPTNFHQTYVGDIGQGVLRFTYQWDSTSGVLSDLEGCLVGEYVDYGEPYGAWLAPLPWHDGATNPTVNDRDARAGMMDDTHGNFSPKAPYFVNSFSASQTYRWKDSLGQYTNLEGHSIDRSIWPDPYWSYVCQKDGSQAIWIPLP